MNQRRHLALVAAAATLLATAPMATVFQSWTWLIDCVVAVGVVCGSAMLSRSLRAPVWAQVLSMVAGLTIIVTLLFGTHAFAGLIPTGGTFHHFSDLLTQATSDIRDYGIPVPDRDGLLFLLTVGVGAVAILVDLFTVGLRQPALAGMPMLPLYSIPVIVHEDSVSFIPFIIGAVGFLWLLASDNVDRVRRFGRRFTGDGRDVDLWEPSPLAAAGRRLAVVGVVIAIAVPLAVPGMTSGLLDQFGTEGDGSGTGTGTGRAGGVVNLFAVLSGNLNLNSTTDMIRVTTDDPAPYYLRFGVADQITTSGFHTRSVTGGKSASAGLPDPTITAPGVSQGTFHANVQVLNFNMALLPTYTALKAIKVDKAWLYDPGTAEVYSNRTTSKKVRNYQFDYVRTGFDPAALRSAKPLNATDPEVKQFTKVPPEEHVAGLVNKLKGKRTNEYDIVHELYFYFSEKNNFTYALSTKSGTSGSEIWDFLNVSKSGYCEQYAAALAWMVRQAGYPARVAFGFTRGLGRNKNTYTLTNQNLHAWTEVYFAGYGWVPFDATPAAGITGPVSTTWAPNVDANDPSTSGGTSATTPEANPSAAAGGGPNDHSLSDTGSAATGAARSHTATWPFWLPGSLLAVLAILAAPALRRRSLRHRRGAGRAALRLGEKPVAVAGADPGQMAVVPDATVDSAVAREQAHAAWDELVDTLVDYGILVDAAETPRVTVERLVKHLHPAAATAAEIRLLGRAEERARYARTPVHEGNLPAALRDLRRTVRDYVGRRTRIRAFLLPPSVTQRWRSRTGDSVVTAVASVGRRREMLVRTLSPRRLLPSRGSR